MAVLAMAQPAKPLVVPVTLQPEQVEAMKQAILVTGLGPTGVIGDTLPATVTDADVAAWVQTRVAELIEVKLRVAEDQIEQQAVEKARKEHRAKIKKVER